MSDQLVDKVRNEDFTIQIFTQTLNSQYIKLTTENGTHNTQLNSNGNYLIDSYSNLNTPNTTKIITTKNGKTNVIYTAENPLKDYNLGTTEFVTLKGNDATTTGLEVSGYILANHITASGNISSSGTIFAQSFVETVSTKTAAGGDLAGAAAVDATNVIFATTDDAAKGDGLLTSIINLASDATSNYITLRRVSLSNVDAIAVTGSVVQADMLGSSVYGNVPFAVRGIMAFNTNDFGISLDGGAVQTDSSVILPAITKLSIGQHYNGGFHLNGCVLNVIYYQKRLANSVIEANSAREYSND